MPVLLEDGKVSAVVVLYAAAGGHLPSSMALREITARLAQELPALRKSVDDVREAEAEAQQKAGVQSKEERGAELKTKLFKGISAQLANQMEVDGVVVFMRNASAASDDVTFDTWLKRDEGGNSFRYSPSLFFLMPCTALLNSVYPN